MPQDEPSLATPPFELRIKIWEFTIAPRVIKFINNKTTYEELGRLPIEVFHAEATTDPVDPRKYRLSIDDTDLPDIHSPFARNHEI